MKLFKFSLGWFLLLWSLVFPLAGMAMTEQPVTLTTPTGTIYGVIALPEQAGPCPVVLLIAGSGPTNMDGNTVINGKTVQQNNSLKWIAEGLAEQGIATLRYDKRGIATSVLAGKEESELRFDDYVADAQGWIEQLRQESRFTAVYVLGHSEGALIGMAACQNNKAVKGVISLAGAGRPAYEIVEEQLANQPMQVRAYVKEVNEKLRVGERVENVPMGLMALFRPSVQPYLTSWYSYNPQEVIAGLKQPVLIVQGDTDIQVAVKDAELLKQAQPRAQYVLLPNMNHVLKECESKEPMAQQLSYSNPSLPLHRELIPTIIQFIQP